MILRFCQFAAVVAVLCGLFRATAGAADDDGPKGVAQKRIGKLIRIELPVTSATVARVDEFIDRALNRALEEKASLTLIFKFIIPPGQEEFAKTTEFGHAFQLADRISGEKAAAAHTVAYIPQSLPGHAVLAALACNEIVMHEGAELGPVGAEPDNIERSAYTEIPNRRKNVPAEVGLWLLDPSQQVFKVETLLGREFALPAAVQGLQSLQELRENRTIESEQPLSEFVEGQRRMFTGAEARRLDFASNRKDSREVAKALGLPREAMIEDPSMFRKWEAVRIDLKGPITAETVRRAQLMIDQARDLRDVNFICLWINSPGGSPADSVNLAGYLGKIDPNEIRVVAYIPSQARSDAALPALACHQVVVKAQAEIGGSGAYEPSQNEIDTVVEAIMGSDSPWKPEVRGLVAAMINPKLEVLRCTRLGKDGEEVAYLFDEEFARRNAEIRQNNQRIEAGEQPGSKQNPWEKDRQVTREGRPLLVSGEQAEEYGLADATVDNFEEFKARYNFKDDLTLLEPGWADFLVEVLASPLAAGILLMVAFMALYVEVSTPGIGIGGFMATVCFLLFFWSHWGGTAGWLEIILFLAGVACLVLEVFVLPGFGIFGLGGGCLVLISLILASQTFVVPQNPYQVAQLQRSLYTIAGAGAGIFLTAFLLRNWLPRAPIFSQVMLKPPAGEEAEKISRNEALLKLEDFVGRQGTTTTQLTPGGKARFGDQLIDVITDGDVIPPGTQIEVVEVHANRLIVKAVGG